MGGAGVSPARPALDSRRAAGVYCAPHGNRRARYRGGGERLRRSRYVRDRDPQRLAAHLGAGAPDVAQRHSVAPSGPSAKKKSVPPILTRSYGLDGRGVVVMSSDGSAAGTLPVRNLTGFTSGALHGLTNVGGKLFFADSSTLWKSDGTDAGTERVFHLPSGSGNISELVISELANELMNDQRREA